MSTLAVVEEILRETKFPMSVRQIVEYADGRLPTRSKTPDTVVARDLSMDIKKKGEQSLFIRTAPGRYTLREIHLQNRENRENRESQESQENQTKDGAGSQAGESMMGHVGQNADKSVTNSTGNGASERAPQRVTEAVASGLSGVHTGAAASASVSGTVRLDGQDGEDAVDDKDGEATSMLSSAMRTERVGTLPAKNPTTSELGHQASTK